MWMHLYLKMDSFIKCFSLFRPLMKNRRWLGWMLVQEENFPQTDATVVLKEDAALDAVKMSHAVLMGLLHDYINYDKEIMKIGSDAWSVFMDYETNCKCIICKNQMLNACSVLFSRNWVYTQSFIHMLTFFHTHMLLLNVIISVLMLWFICVLSCQNSL